MFMSVLLYLRASRLNAMMQLRHMPSVGWLLGQHRACSGDDLLDRHEA
jgi:hypothetical protein